MRSYFQSRFNLKKILDSAYFKEPVAYASNDAGKSFKSIISPVGEYRVTSNLQYCGTDCEFATSSKESTLTKNEKYCVHTLESGRYPRLVFISL